MHYKVVIQGICPYGHYNEWNVAKRLTSVVDFNDELYEMECFGKAERFLSVERPTSMIHAPRKSR